MKRWLVILSVVLFVGAMTVAAAAKPIHIGGGPQMETLSSPIHIGGGPQIETLSSPIHIGGGPQ